MSARCAARVADARLLFDVLTRLRADGRLRHRRHEACGSASPAPISSITWIGDVAASFERACGRLSQSGVKIETVSIPHAADTAPIYVTLALAEAAEYHASTLEANGPTTTTRTIRVGWKRHATSWPRTTCARAAAGACSIAEVDRAVGGVDALLLPTLPVPAQPVGAATVRIGDWEDSVRNTLLRLTQTFNVTGHPAITLPCEPTPAGLPVGVQLVGARGGTHRLLDVAAALEPLIASVAASAAAAC